MDVPTVLTSQSLIDKRRNNPAALGLTTALLADACMRLSLPLKVAPVGIQSLFVGTVLSGPVLPVTHYGSVDVFLEALQWAKPGDVLVIDNAGMMDEACIGDLIVAEGQQAGLAGIVVWGCHRDTTELKQLKLPVFSYGACPVGPRGVEQRTTDPFKSVRFGAYEVNNTDWVFADDDGVLFLPLSQLSTIVAAATDIGHKEKQQITALQGGTSLRQQFQFADYLQQRRQDAQYTFRDHLRRLQKSIEE